MDDWLPCFTCRQLDRSARLVAHMRTLIARIHRQEHSKHSTWKHCQLSPCRETLLAIEEPKEGAEK